MANELPPNLTAITAACLSSRFLFHEFRQLVQLIFAPLVATAIVLYASLWAYITELIAFIATGDARAASVALGALTAGVFLCMFFSALAVSAVVNLMLRNQRAQGWIRLHPARQDWRLYAAYMRFLLLLSGYFSAVYLVCALALPAVGLGRTTIGIVAFSAATAGFYALFARIGFFIPPIVAGSTGPVLRRALQEGSVSFGRNLALIALLSVPSFAIQLTGQVLFKAATHSISDIELDLSITTYARALESRLPEFALLFSLSLFVTLVLFTASSLECYRGRLFAQTDEQHLEHGIAAPENP